MRIYNIHYVCVVVVCERFILCICWFRVRVRVRVKVYIVYLLVLCVLCSVVAFVWHCIAYLLLVCFVDCNVCVHCIGCVLLVVCVCVYVCGEGGGVCVFC